MTEFLYIIVEIISKIHNMIMALNDNFETSFSDKQLHFLVIGILGMGMFEFIEQYKSEQGYKVNLVRSTMADGAEEMPENFQPEYRAIFVAEGI